MFMILGGVFVVFCLFCYLGPRTLEAFIDPPEPAPAPPALRKYTKLGDYTLDRSATVLHKQKQRDNTQLKRLRDMFRIPNVVEAYTSECGEFGCCEKLGIPKSNKEGSNCNGFCPYNDSTDTTPTSGPTPPPPTPPPPTPPPPTPPPQPTYPQTNTDTVFIAPPVSSPYVSITTNGSPVANDSTNDGKCGTCPKPEPCPPCGRCPEPSFDCKKVPNYGSTNSEYLPMPVLSDFSSFGM